MPVELERQLREYGEILGSYVHPSDVSADSSAVPARGRSPWLIAVAAAVVVAIAVGGTALLISRGAGLSPTDIPDDQLVTTSLLPEAVSETSSQPASSVPVIEPATPEATVPATSDSVYFVAQWSSEVDAIHRIEAVWYVNEQLWRRETLGVFDGEPADATFVIIRSEDEVFRYWYIDNTFDIRGPDQLTQADLESPIADGGLFPPVAYECDETGRCDRVAGDHTGWDNCTLGPGGLVAGQPTTRYFCSRPVLIEGITETETIALWIDENTLQTLKMVMIDYWSYRDRADFMYEVLELDSQPVFDAALFEFKCPVEDCIQDQ